MHGRCASPALASTIDSSPSHTPSTLCPDVSTAGPVYVGGDRPCAYPPPPPDIIFPLPSPHHRPSDSRLPRRSTLVSTTPPHPAQPLARSPLHSAHHSHGICWKRTHPSLPSSPSTTTHHYHPSTLFHHCRPLCLPAIVTLSRAFPLFSGTFPLCPRSCPCAYRISPSNNKHCCLLLLRHLTASTPLINCSYCGTE